MRKLLVVLFAAAFVACLSMPASALDFGGGNDIRIRGEIGLDTKWTKTDSQLNGTPWSDTDINWDNNGSKLRFDPLLSQLMSVSLHGVPFS